MADVSEFPKRGPAADEPDVPPVNIVGLDMQIKFICKCDPTGTVLVCLGKLHEAVCPHCRRAYRLTFLHFDPSDAATHASDGTPQLGINLGWRQLDGVIIPPTHRRPPGA